MGAARLLLQNWLLSAVNKSGAVSPLIRATASSTPVTSPARAARYATRMIMYERGRPSAVTASRSGPGTRSSMSSVVRTTTGTTITASAKAPADAGEMAHAHDDNLVHKQTDYDRGRAQENVVDEAHEEGELRIAAIFGHVGARQHAKRGP